LAQGLAAGLAVTLQQQHQLLPAPATCLLLPSLHPRLLQRPLLPRQHLQHSRQLQHLLLTPMRTRRLHMPDMAQQQRTRVPLQLLPSAAQLLAVTACRDMVDLVTALVQLAQARVLTHQLHLQPAAMVMPSVPATARML
jgi:hypothetical protein